MRVLIIRPGAIGDTLLTLPVIQALKEQWTAAHVSLIGNAAVLPLAQATGIVDAAFDYEDIRWGKLFVPGMTVAAWRALFSSDEALGQGDMVICWLHDAEGVVARNLSAASIGRVIVAPGRPPEGERQHIVDYLMRTLGLPWQVDYTTLPPLLPAPPSVPDPRPLAIHPGSGGARKCWPVAHFATVITSLWQRQFPILLLAGPADEARLSELRSLLPSPPTPALLTVLANAPLLEVARQLQTCKAYLGNDSGITHLAALLAVPTIALFGSSDPAIWHPIGRTVKVLYEPVLANLSPDHVLSELEALL